MCCVEVVPFGLRGDVPFIPTGFLLWLGPAPFGLGLVPTPFGLSDMLPWAELDALGSRRAAPFGIVGLFMPRKGSDAGPAGVGAKSFVDGAC